MSDVTQGLLRRLQQLESLLDTQRSLGASNVALDSGGTASVTLYAPRSGTAITWVLSDSEGAVAINGTSALTSSFWGTSYSDGEGPQFALRRARGTSAAPGRPSDNDTLGGISFRGYNGTVFTGSRGLMQFQAAETWDAGAEGTYGRVLVTPRGGVTAQFCLIFDSSRAIGIPDGITAPGASDAGASVALIYVDSADGNFKIRFGNGVVKTLATNP